MGDLVWKWDGVCEGGCKLFVGLRVVDVVYDWWGWGFDCGGVIFCYYCSFFY